MASIVEREENAYTLGVQAGLWGYPLAHRVEAFPIALSVKVIALNSFQKFDRLKTAEDRFVVTPNNLTIDAYAIFDTSREPVVVHVPKLDAPRWYIVQIGDAFDDVTCNLGGTRPAVPGTYAITGPDYHGRIPGDMVPVPSRTNVGFVDVRIAVSGAADLDCAVWAQQGFHLVPLHRYLVDGITASTVEYGPIESPDLTAPDDLALFDRLGAAMRYMLPVHADVTDTFVQALATIGLSVGHGFAWQTLDESTLAGLRQPRPWSTGSSTNAGPR